LSESLTLLLPISRGGSRREQTRRCEKLGAVVLRIRATVPRRRGKTSMLRFADRARAARTMAALAAIHHAGSARKTFADVHGAIRVMYSTALSGWSRYGTADRHASTRCQAACSAITAACGNAAASAKLRAAGLATRLCWCARHTPRTPPSRCCTDRRAPRHSASTASLRCPPKAHDRRCRHRAYESSACASPTCCGSQKLPAGCRGPMSSPKPHERAPAHRPHRARGLDLLQRQHGRRSVSFVGKGLHAAVR